MDLIQIGKFIASMRKENNLSQEQLGEKLGVTNKTISRWETGTYLPPAEMLLSMSELFNVSINEILSGKRLGSEEFREKAESNLFQAVKSSSFTLKEKIAFYKKKWLKDHIYLLCSIGVGIIATLVSGIVLKNELIVLLSFFLLIIGHAWRNNSMMIYIEKNAFDGSGSND